MQIVLKFYGLFVDLSVRTSRRSDSMIVPLRLAIVMLTIPGFWSCSNTKFASNSKAVQQNTAEAGALDPAAQKAGTGDPAGGTDGKIVYVPLGGTADIGSTGACQSTNKDIATCSNGVVTGNKLGTTTVTLGSTPGSSSLGSSTPGIDNSGTGSASGGSDGSSANSLGGSSGKVTVIVYDPKNPPPGVDVGSGSGGKLSSNSACLAAKADDYNILLVFDNTGSQNHTDPTDARGAGGQLFVQQWEQYVQTNPSATVRIAVLSFNTKSIHSAQGWILLDGKNANLINQQIQSATSNPDGGTAYSPVLNDASSYFKQVNALPNAPRSRNYMVFATDGIPNACEASQGGTTGIPAVDNACAQMRQNPPDCSGTQQCSSTLWDRNLVESMSAIPPAVTNLTQNYGVAIYAIATGTGVPANGQAVVQYLAQPTKGVVASDHVGHYYSAQTAQQMTSVFGNLISTIGGCSNSAASPSTTNGGGTTSTH